MSEVTEETKKVCPRCGYKNKKENSHCKKCGWPLDATNYKDD